jgi:hypothetical protein
VFFSLLITQGPAADKPKSAKPLFDGKTLKGWEGNLKWFRVEDGAIVAGSSKMKIPRNEFLCTTSRYSDFELRVTCKIAPGTTNAGIQFRTERIPNHHEVKGYQADMGEGWWGKIYDESRRRKALAEPDAEQLAKVLKPEDWNQYVIRCQGPHIELWINGFKTADFTEPNASIPRDGIIALQIHGGPAGEAWYKDIVIEELK